MKKERVSKRVRISMCETEIDRAREGERDTDLKNRKNQRTAGRDERGEREKQVTELCSQVGLSYGLSGRAAGIKSLG